MTATCMHCGQTMAAPAKHQRFCSKECRTKARQQQYGKELDFKQGLRPASTTGAISELTAAADLLRRGYHVFRSVAPNSPCDLVILKDDRLQKVEVTTGSRTGFGKLCYPGKTGSNYSFDVLAVVEHDGKVTYLPLLRKDDAAQ